MDEPIIVFLFIFVGAAIVFFVVRHAYQQGKVLDEVYDHVAYRLGGEAVPGGLLGRPWIRFKFAGATARIDIYSTGGKHAKFYTQLHLSWLDPELRCDIYPEHFLHNVGKMLGMRDIQIDSPEFDDRFMILGNSPEEIRRLLSVEVQLAIESLRRFLGNNDIFISIRGGRLLIKKRSLIRDQQTLERFVRLGTKLHNVASQTNIVGIDFVDADRKHATISLESAVCQVCGDEITIDAVFCRSCKTPHHRDCWQYYGSCSTYGCGQKKFLVVKKEARRRNRTPKIE